SRAELPEDRVELDVHDRLPAFVPPRLQERARPERRADRVAAGNEGREPAVLEHEDAAHDRHEQDRSRHHALPPEGSGHVLSRHHRLPFLGVETTAGAGTPLYRGQRGREPFYRGRLSGALSDHIQAPGICKQKTWPPNLAAPKRPRDRLKALS